MSSAVRRHLAEDPDGEPGPGKRVPADHLLRQTQLAAHLPHLVLEQLAQRLEQRERQPLGQPADVVVGLDRDRGPALGRERLDHVGVERALHQEAHVVPDRARLGLEDVDEGVADAPPLLLGIGDAGQALEELRARVHHPEIDAEVAPEGGLHLLALVQAEQPVIHEDAGEPVAHGPVHQHRGHRRVHAAREPADHPPVGADQLADPRRSRSRRSGPAVQSGVTPQTSNRKLLRISPPRGVWATSGWNCTPNSGRVGVLERGDGAVVARRGDPVARRRHVHVVAVAHPDRGLLAPAEAAGRAGRPRSSRWPGRTPAGWPA